MMLSQSSTQSSMKSKAALAQPPANICKSVTSQLKWLRQHWWLAENVAAVVCILCMVGLSLLFWLCDGHPDPKWPLAMTVSSLSAIITKILEFHLASLLLSSILRQLKLLWFRRIHPLGDIKKFDDAISGPVGAIRLVWLQRGMGLGSFAAALMILYLPIGFFIQQAIIIQMTEIGVGSGSVPRNVRFDKYGPGEIPSLGTIDLPIQSAVYNGLYNEDVSIFKIPVNCLTGNCQFPIYSSLAVGSICQRRDDQILTSCSNSTVGASCTYSLPDGGPSVDGSDVTLNQSSCLNGSSFPEFSQQLVSLQTIGSPGIGSATVSALACALYLTVNTYSSTVKNGIYTEVVIAQYHNSTPVPRGQPDWVISPTNSSEGPFSMSGMSVDAEQEYLWQMLAGSVSGGVNQPIYSSDIMQVIASTFRSGDLPKRLENIARIVSDAKRTSGYSQNASGHPNELTPEAAFGIASASRNVVRIRWPWLALPGTLAVASIVLLVVVIVQMRAYSLERLEGGSVPWIEAGPNDDGRNRLQQEHGNCSMAETAGEASYQMENKRFTYVS